MNNATTTFDPGAPGVSAAARITVITAPGCHYCRDALDALAEIGATIPLEVTEVDVRTPVGMSLMQQHGAAMSPLVLLDGSFVSAGRLPRGKLRSLLIQRVGRVTS